VDNSLPYQHSINKKHGVIHILAIACQDIRMLKYEYIKQDTICFKSFKVFISVYSKTHLIFKAYLPMNFKLDEKISERRLDAYDCVRIHVLSKTFTITKTKNMIKYKEIRI